MSLKDFHILFIVASILCSLSFGYWAVQQYLQQPAAGYLLTAIVCGAVAAALIIYEWFFIRKMKKES